MCINLRRRLDSYIVNSTNRLLRIVRLSFMHPRRPTPLSPLGKMKPILPLAMWYNLDSNRLMTFSNLPDLEHLAAEYPIAWLSALAPNYQQHAGLGIGLVLLVIVLFAPQGIAGLFRRHARAA